MNLPDDKSAEEKRDLVSDTPQEPPVTIDMGNPWLAAILAWLIPGLGHIYQRRFMKATIYAVCILGTFYTGMALGGNHPVYFAWEGEDLRWQYIPQAGVGLPALPAYLQHRHATSFNGYDDPYDRGDIEQKWGGYMAPPRYNFYDQSRSIINERHAWHKQYHMYFEMGTLYTMVAGLLNLLAVFDAFGGPAYMEQKRSKQPA